MSDENIPFIVIPYRNREKHLDCLLSRLKDFPVLVVEQFDANKFNRGALLNIGFKKAQKLGANRVILHDCDLIPDDVLLCMYKERWPLPVVHFGARFQRYNNRKSYFGGVHGFHVDYFVGYPNNFWGWGGEDDALRKRIDLRNVTYARKGEYLDLEGYKTAKDKLKNTPHSERCSNKFELLQSDNAAHDNHYVSAVQHEESWKDEDQNIVWGFITFKNHTT